MKINEAIENRHSIRAFSSKKVKWGDIIEAIDSALKIPLAGNINASKFIVVENEATKQDIAHHAQQNWIVDAQYIIIVCSDSLKLNRMYHERGEIYTRQQAGAAIQTLLLKLTDLGLAACWVGAYADELCKQCLKIPEHIQIEAIVPIGYAAKKQPSRKIKKDSLENAIYWETWGNNRKK